MRATTTFVSTFHPGSTLRTGQWCCLGRPLLVLQTERVIHVAAVTAAPLTTRRRACPGHDSNALARNPASARLHVGCGTPVAGRARGADYKGGNGAPSRPEAPAQRLSPPCSATARSAAASIRPPTTQNSSRCIVGLYTPTLPHPPLIMALAKTFSLAVLATAAVCLGGSVLTADAARPLAASADGSISMAPQDFMDKYCDGTTLDTTMSVTKGSGSWDGQCRIQLGSEISSLTLGDGAQLSVNGSFNVGTASFKVEDVTLVVAKGAQVEGLSILIQSRVGAIEVRGASLKVTSKWGLFLSAAKSIVFESGSRLAAPESFIEARSTLVVVKSGASFAAKRAITVSAYITCKAEKGVQTSLTEGILGIFMCSA